MIIRIEDLWFVEGRLSTDPAATHKIHRGSAKPRVGRCHRCGYVAVVIASKATVPPRRSHRQNVKLDRPGGAERHYVPSERLTMSLTSRERPSRSATRLSTASARARRLASRERQLLKAASSRAATCGFFLSIASTVSAMKS